MRDLYWRIKRSWKLLRVYYNTEDCDWSTIAMLMRHQIRRTRLHVEECGISADSDKMSRQMLIAETLLDRMLEDSVYFEIADKRYPHRGKPWAKLITEVQHQDEEMLARLLQKHLRCWWD